MGLTAARRRAFFLVGMAPAWLAACGDSGSTGGAPPGHGSGGSTAGSGAQSGGAPKGGGAGQGAAGLGGAAGAGGTTAGAAGAGAGAAGGSGGAAGAMAGASGASAGTAGAAGVAGAAGRAGGGEAGAGTAGAAAGAGMPSGGAGAGMAGSAGAGMAADPVFTPNIRLNDDTGRGRQAEVALASGPGGLAIAGWMDERSERVCAFSVTTDRGDTWSTNVSIAVTPMQGAFVGDPAVGIDGGGTLYAGCQDYGQKQIKLMTSTDQGAHWSTVSMIQSAPDKPWLGGGTADGVVFVSWLGDSAGIKRSRDHGATWDPIEPLGNIIHGTAIVTGTSGLVHVPYNLDSARNQLRYVRSKDSGATWENPRDLIANMGTFGFNDMPRQHPIVGAASDPTGRITAITWSSVMPAGQSAEDVWLLYSDDGGDTWTQPIRVNDNTDDTRQFQSWVAIDAHGRVHVVWTDLRTDGKNKTYYARSDDPRQGFEPSIQVTDQAGTAQTDFLGDYKGIVISGPDVLVVWNDTRRDSGDIYFSKAPGAAGP